MLKSPWKFLTRLLSHHGTAKTKAHEPDGSLSAVAISGDNKQTFEPVAQAELGRRFGLAIDAVALVAKEHRMGSTAARASRRERRSTTADTLVRVAAKWPAKIAVSAMDEGTSDGKHPPERFFLVTYTSLVEAEDDHAAAEKVIGNLRAGQQVSVTVKADEITATSVSVAASAPDVNAAKP